MIIKRETLQAVLPAATSDDTRYTLAVVQVQPDGRAVATDGHILLIAQDKYPQKDEDFPAITGAPYTSDPAEPVLIPLSMAQRLIGAMPKKSPIPILKAAQLSTNGDGGCVISATDLEVPCVVHVPKPEGSFPQWQRVLPRADRPALSVSLSIEVLEHLIKAAKAVQDKGKLGTITLQIPTEHQHQGRRAASHEYEASPDVCDGPECPCVHCQAPRDQHLEPDGNVIDVLGLRIPGAEVEITGAVMPCRA